MIRWWFKRPAVLAGIGALSLIVAACGGGGSSDSGPEAAGAVAAPAVLGLIETSNPDDLTLGTKIGQLAPNFRLASSDGGNIELSNLRGRPVLLNFFATWCGPCRFEMPDVQAFHEQLGDSLTVLAVDLRETPEMVNEFKSSLGLTFLTVIDSDRAVFNEYALLGLPSTFLLDADGVVRGVKFGPFADRNEIDGILEEVDL